MEEVLDTASVDARHTSHHARLLFNYSSQKA